LKRRRIARCGGVEAAPKTGESEGDCGHDASNFRGIGRLKCACLRTVQNFDFVVTDERGTPLSQERLHGMMWLPTIFSISLWPRGQYDIPDTFNTCMVGW